MSITRHHTGAYYFQFDRRIPGRGRQRANRLLPKEWTKAQAQEYDRTESARLYALATGVTKSEPLIEDAVLLYLQQHAPTLKNFKDLQSAFALCHSAYAGKPLSALPDVARQYIASNSKLSTATIRNRLAYLRAACRWAWKTHHMGDHDPAERMVLPKAGQPRLVYFDRATMLRIAKAIKHRPSRSAFRVAFYTGLRRGEILRSKYVLASGQAALLIDDTKNGKPHIIPAHPRIAHLVRSAAWPPQVHRDTLSHKVIAAMRKLGMTDTVFHSARHSAATEMLNAGVDLNTVGEVLNHKSVASTKVYAHLATSKLAAAVQNIGKKAKNSHPHPTAKAA